MRIAYGDEVYDAAFADRWTRSMLIESAESVTGGVPIATPVFDGAKEADVNDALIRAGSTSRASRRSSTGARARRSRAR
jgi:DNA-directed RNA polymerase subunit beta